jgi:hypothetical protein
VPAALFAALVVAFVAVAALVIWRTQVRHTVFERLPVEADEQVLLEEEGLTLFHRFRRLSRHGRGGTVTVRVRSVLTDRRLLLATGGPEGKHRFVLRLILDYTTPSPPVPETGSAAYRRKFGLRNGYPTYGCSPADVTVEEDGGETRLRVVVSFPEAGDGWGDPPEVRLSTPQAARYAEAIRAVAG